MNIERMEMLARFLSVMPKKRFNMHRWFSVDGQERSVLSADVLGRMECGCGTTACVAGWATFLFSDPVPQDRFLPNNHARSVAQKLLDLSDDQEEWLFIGRWSKAGINEGDPRKAAMAVRRLIEFPSGYDCEPFEL